MNYQLQNADRMSQYHRLILYIEYANETSAILNGEEVYAYFYNNFAMDMYINKQSRMDATDAKIEMYIKRALSWFAFYLFCRMAIYIIKQLRGALISPPIRIVINEYR